MKKWIIFIAVGIEITECLYKNKKTRKLNKPGSSCTQK